MDEHVSFRIDSRQKEKLTEFASKLGMDLSSLLRMSIDSLAGRLPDEAWTARRVHLCGTHVCGLGGEVPDLPHQTFTVVAPESLFVALEFSLLQEREG